jgi:hypothetical protein
LSVSALYNSSLSAANQGVFALSSGTVTVNGGIVFATVPLFGPTLTLASGNQNGTLTLSGSTPFTITGGGSSTFTANGTNAIVIYSGTAQTVQAATYQNLFLSGSGTKTITGVTVNGTLSRQGTATASAAPVYGANSTLEYKGSAAQTGGPELAASLASLTINNVNGVTVPSSPTISNTLTFASGRLNTGAYQINLGTNGSISGGGAASYVNGNLQKAFSTGTKTFTFAIGDASAYAPLTLSNLTVMTAGSVKANTTSGSHPQFGTSGLDPNRNVNRYWTLTQSGGAFGAYNATFGYPATDVDISASPSQFAVRRWTGSAWSPATVNGIPTTTIASIIAQSGFGDFVIGNTSPWYNGAWLYRVAITIDHTKVAGPLTNFPVLISLTNSALQQYAQAGGNDLLFTSNDGSTKLAHEIESYTSSNGSLVAWVNVPLLSATSDTLLYLYYGNSSTTNQQSVAATWGSSFKGVWHFNNVFTDSTSNNYVGTNTGTINAAGKISNGRGFVRSNGVDYITVTGLMGSPSNLTLSVWINLASLDTGGAEFISLGDYAAVRQDNTGILGYFYDGSTWDNTFSYTNAVGTGWRYVVYSRDAVGKTQKLYVDGVQIASSAFTNSISYSGTGANTFIGKHGNGQTGFSFDGTMDEVRVSQTARNFAWVGTEYNNQNSPGSFRSIGIMENVQPTKLAVTSVNGGSSPAVGTAFNVVVQAQDDGGTPQNVRSNTAISLSLNTGTGTLGGTLTGTIPAGTISVTISGVTYTKAESGVSLTATPTSGDNLTAANSSSFTIIPGNQTITFPSPGNQTYGVGPITLGATTSSGLPVSYSVTSGPATVTSNTLTIIGAGSVIIQASQSGNANWNAATSVNQTISIAQKTITGAITANNKTYDTITAATIASRTLSGVTNSDVVNLTGGTATFAGKNVGNGKTVMVTGLSLTGANAGNYVLASTSATNTANITKATLTVSATGVNKIYDGTTNTTVTLSDNRLAGDVLTTSYTSASFADENVGNGKTVSVSGIAISGTDSGNYTANTTASTTANITKATLTVSATGMNKIYDGTTNATVTLADNRLAGDVLTTSYTSASFADKNVGNGKTVSVSGIAISGTDSGNYTANTTASTTANITKAGATVTLGNLNQTYNGSSVAATASTTPTGLTVNLTYNGLANAPTNAGSYTVIGTINDANYQGSATNTLVIAKATGTVNLGSLSQTYNGTAKAATASTTPTGLPVNLTYNGLANAPTNAGSYTVIGVINDANYQGSATNTLVIAKATRTVNLGNLSQTYTGTAEPATASTTPTGLTVNLTYNGLAKAPTNAGSYTVIGTINDANYSGSATNMLLIAKAAVTVSSGLTANDKIYDGTTTATLSSNNVGLAGVAAGDDADAILSTNGYTATFANATVGTNNIVTVSGLTLTGSAATNYILTQPDLFANITAAPLTVTANDTNRVYGAANPVFTFSYNGFVAGEDAGVVSGVPLLTTTATTNSSVTGGPYPITITQNTLSATNYSFNLVNGNLTVTPAPLTVIADNKSRAYGTTNPMLTASYNGFVNDENTNQLSGSPALNTEANINSLAGVYPIQVAQGTLTNANYAFSFANGTLTIIEVPPVLTISFAAGTTGQTNYVDLHCAGLTPGGTYYIDASTNLPAEWLPIVTLQAAQDGTITFTDTNAVQYPTRFYRLSDD